jgi:chemotaxis protein MotA
LKVLQTMSRLFDPAALALVGLGSVAAAALRSTGEDIGAALKALGPMVRASPARDALAARRAVVQIERVVAEKGIACADQVHGESAFVRKAAIKLVDAASAEAFSAWVAEELAMRRTRQQAAAAVWRAAADASPSVGMVGTVLGLIGMFASLEDPAAMGPAMALAMLTTLYGLVFGAFVFGPIAARLERLAAAEMEWQWPALSHLERLALVEGQSAESWLRHRAKAPG